MTRRGFTMPELMIAIMVGMLALAMVMRPASTYISRSRVNRASAIVAGDLEMARTLAERQHAPVRLAFDSASGRYTITNRSTGAVLWGRSIGLTSDFKVRTISFAPQTLDFFPSGVASGSLVVTLTASAYNRQVTMNRIGLVRLP